MKRYAAGIGWALAMLVLILDGQTALAGAAEGVELCLKTLIPSLFPFFVLSSMLAGSLPGGLLISGILSGYPVGAANVAAARRAGKISAAEAERMVVVCNCAGPSFLFGVVGPVLGGPGKAAGVWIACLGSVFLLWLVFPKSKHIPGCIRPVPVQVALYASLRAMAGVCGWVVLLRVLLCILDRWVLWLLPRWAQICIYGLLELSNGCLALKDTAPGTAFVLAAGMVSFGGICVMLQTAGAAEGISLRLYFPGKVFQAAVSMLVASFLVPGSVTPALQAVLALTTLVLIPVLRKTEKRSGNYCAVGV